MDLVKGEATVFPKPGVSFDPVLIFKAIHDAGFTASEVEVAADGAAAAKEGALELDVPGLKHPFILAGGPQEGSLKKQKDLVGKRIRVVGKLSPAEGNLPPALSVESFRSSARNEG